MDSSVQAGRDPVHPLGPLQGPLQRGSWPHRLLNPSAMVLGDTVPSCNTRPTKQPLTLGFRPKGTPLTEEAPRLLQESLKWEPRKVTLEGHRGSGSKGRTCQGICPEACWSHLSTQLCWHLRGSETPPPAPSPRAAVPTAPPGAQLQGETLGMPPSHLGGERSRSSGGAAPQRGSRMRAGARSLRGACGRGQSPSEEGEPLMQVGKEKPGAARAAAQGQGQPCTQSILSG